MKTLFISSIMLMMFFSAISAQNSPLLSDEELIKLYSGV